MAELEKHGDRKDWLRWAIEFMHRGIWPDETITVHGPHGPDASYMWGEAEGHLDLADRFEGCSVVFRTASGIRGIYDVRGVTVKDREGNKYPKLKLSELTSKARRWLAVAERLSERLIQDAISEHRAIRRVEESLRKNKGREKVVVVSQ